MILDKIQPKYKKLLVLIYFLQSLFIFNNRSDYIILILVSYAYSPVSYIIYIKIWSIPIVKNLYFNLSHLFLIIDQVICIIS